MQIDKIKNGKLKHACLYPTKKELVNHVQPNYLADRPFERKLALGDTQLSHIAFDLSALELYRNDPRFHFELNDFGGKICIRTEFDEEYTTPESDKILQEHFGYAYDANLNRAVAVLLYDLRKLSPEHQRIWQAKQIDGDYQMHPNFRRMMIFGDWPDGISIFSAFLAEMRLINEISKLMGRESLFRQDFADDNRPRNFTFLLRPTLHEYNEFVHLLDKLLSENINLGFFKDDIAIEYEHHREDGKIEVRRRGSIQILKLWIENSIRLRNPNDISKITAPMKVVRKLRQKPAHSHQEDRFDQDYLRKQRELMLSVYTAVRHLRSLFMCHPVARNIQIPNYLESGKIWEY